MNAVVGMHRSGTSFTCNLLGALGANCGSSELLLEGDNWNKRGYFENREIVSLNNELILGDLANNLYWKVLDSPLNDHAKAFLKSLLNLPAFIHSPEKGIARRGKQKRAEISRLAQKYEDLLVKDVRFSLTIGAWQACNAINKTLYCYRHPMEVALSLKKRQHIPLRLGLKLWDQHVRTFFDQAGGLDCVMVQYSNFFNEQRVQGELRRLHSFLGREWNPELAETSLNRVLDPELRHNILPDSKLPQPIAQTYAKLNALHEKYSRPTKLP